MIIILLQITINLIVKRIRYVINAIGNYYIKEINNIQSTVRLNIIIILL